MRNGLVGRGVQINYLNTVIIVVRRMAGWGWGVVGGGGVLREGGYPPISLPS